MRDAPGRTGDAAGEAPARRPPADPGPPVAVLGAGSWGTALALLLARNGRAVRMWHRDARAAARLAEDRENKRRLPGHPFPPELSVEPGLEDAVAPAGEVLVAVPSHAFAEVIARAARAARPEAGIAWATKGLDPGSGRWLHEVAVDALGSAARAAVVSGPTFAREVAEGLPAAVAVACADLERARRLAALLHGPRFRAYANDDVVGVSVGGALKNVLAVAAGAADGLGLGANARAAIIARGLGEMLRLGEAIGARPATLMGLAGLGDLVLTCTGDQSRNRRFGLALAAGDDPGEALARMDGVVEGAPAAAAVLALARRLGVELPITEQVAAVVRGDATPRQAVEALLARAPAAEYHDEE